MNTPSRNQQPMHPQDMRNLFIFCILSVVLYFGYDHFIHRPQMEALQRQQAQMQAQGARQAAPQGATPAPVSRPQALGHDPRLAFENARVRGTIALRGARLDDLALKDYYQTLERKENVEILSPRGTDFPRAVEFGWISADNRLSLPGANTLWSVQGNAKLTPDTPVTLAWRSPQGLFFTRSISMDQDFMMTVTQAVKNESGAPVKLHAYALVTQEGRPADFVANWLLHEGPIGYFGDTLHEVTYAGLQKSGNETYEAANGWTGITDKYWLVGLIPPQGEKVQYNYHFNGIPTHGKKEIDHGHYQSDFTGPETTLAPGQSASSQSRVFAGAKQVLVLERYENQQAIPNFSLAVNFGWFWFFSKPFFYALHYLSAVLGNLGLAIVVVTLVVRCSVFPLTNASYRSFAKMKKVAPQVSELRKLYGDDKKKLQEELLKLYQSEGVNPMAGCLPMLLQIPIFFALYKVLYVTIEMRHAPFFGWIKDLSAPDPTNIFTLFGLIPWEPPGFLHIGLWPLMMLLAMIVQKKLNPPPQDPIQRDMANYFPFVICYVMSKFPAGLILYWTLSALIGIAQQIIIMRSLGVPIHILGQTEDEKQIEKSVDAGVGVNPLLEMAERDVEKALFPEDTDTAAPRISPPRPKKKKKK